MDGRRHTAVVPTDGFSVCSCYYMKLYLSAPRACCSLLVVCASIWDRRNRDQVEHPISVAATNVYDVLCVSAISPKFEIYTHIIILKRLCQYLTI